MNESPEQAEGFAEDAGRGDVEDSRAFASPSPTRVSGNLLACPKCARNNAASRVRCLYCGTLLFALDDTDTPGDTNTKETYDPTAIATTEAEHLYLVLTKREDEEWTEELLIEAARIAGKRDAAWTGGATTRGGATGTSSSTANNFYANASKTVGDLLPLLRVGSPVEARAWRERFAANNLMIEVFSAADLQTEVAPQNIRRASWDEEYFVGFTSAGVGGAQIKLRWQDIALIVAGRIYTRQFSVREQHGRKSESAALDTHETSSDDQVLDIYTLHDRADAGRSTGWRIAASNFDFGCLGARKSLLVADNFRELTAHLRGAAPQARFDDSYRRVRRLLADVLPLDEQASGGGMKRAQFGRTISESVIETSNEKQFTIYGRVLRQHYDARENVGGQHGHEAIR